MPGTWIMSFNPLTSPDDEYLSKTKHIPKG